MCMLQTSLYHSLLRISALTFALVLLFWSGLVNDATGRLALHTQQYMANAVGVRVGVAPTELNEITAALTEKEQQLSAREERIAEREIAIGLSDGEGSLSQQNGISVYVLSSILFILLILIVLNYVLDYLRAGSLDEKQNERAAST